MRDLARDEALVAAIHGQRLVRFATDILEDPATTDGDRERADRALHTCRRIGRRMREEHDTVRKTLLAAGIASLDSARSGPLQRHHTEIVVGNASDARRAVHVLAESGYRPRHRWSGGAAHSFWVTSSEVTVSRTGEATLVVTIRWSEARPGSRWSRATRPTPADWAAIELPTWLWWGYRVVRPVRLISTRVRPGHRTRTDLEPFLATPQSLIAPLLDAADVDTADVVMDFGCGDGRLVIGAAEERGCRAIGVERSAELVELARSAAARSPAHDAIRIVHGDALSADVTETTVVVMFLPLIIVSNVLEDLLRRLPAGARVLVHEQSPLPTALPVPTRSIPVIADDALTVAHIWAAER